MSEKLFSNFDYCCNQMSRIRELMGLKTTTKKHYEQLEKCAAAIYLYCPDEIRDTAYGLCLELTMRKVYFKKMWNEGGN